MDNSERFLRIEEVMHRAGLRRTKIYDLIAKKEFPAPIKIGVNSVWPSSAITEWQQKVMQGHASE